MPAKLRRALGLKADDQLIAETTPEGLLLRPAVTLPIEIYTPGRERTLRKPSLRRCWPQSRRAVRRGPPGADTSAAMRVFLDANILFSAAKSDGAVRALLHLLVDRGHECWADAYVVTEARRNLAAKGPEALQTLDALLGHLTVAAAGPAGTAADAVSWLPEKDRPVLAAAIRLGCDVLVTGDRTHFDAGYGKAFGSVTIDSPRSLAERPLA